MKYAFDTTVIDPRGYQIHRNGETLAVEPLVFDLIVLLVLNRSHVVTKAELIQRVWAEAHVEDSAITRAICLARRAVGKSAIRTVHRRGYQWVAPIRERDRAS